MNKGLAFALGLVFGLGSGTAVSYMVLKQQFDQKAEEEIAACRQAFTEENVKLRKELDKKKTEETKAAATEAIKTYSPEPEKAAAVRNQPMAEQSKKPEQKTDKKRPYVIDPAVFDSPSNPYKTIGFMYYTDGAVLDENHEPLTMEDLDKYVGREALTHFGEYEENRVCVRNEELGIDFEICMQGITYAEALKTRPWVQR